ncbi:MAG: hypothetical protein WB809_00635 [Thermoplasmata archaeon]
MQEGSPSVREPRGPPALTEPAGIRWVRIVGLVGANVLGTLAVLSFLLPTLSAELLIVLLLLATFVVAYEWGLVRDHAFLASWVGIAVVVAVASVITGWHNGLTDEPFVTPVFAQVWPNLYGTSVSVTYDQYGTAYTVSNVYNVYLPGLAFAAIPGISYKWTALGAWIAGVYLLRRRGASVVLWGGSWVGLMAANGFNDFVPFLTLILAYVTLDGRSSRVAEVVSLGLKQFANVVVVALHLYHRRWRDAALAVVITAAILAPFAYFSPQNVWCHAILIQPGDCSKGAGSVLGLGVLDHLNYLLWPVWAVAVFGTSYVHTLRAAGPGGLRGWAGERLRRFGSSAPRAGVPP